MDENPILKAYPRPPACLDIFPAFSCSAHAFPCSLSDVPVRRVDEEGLCH